MVSGLEKLYLERAQNELSLAKAIFELSINKDKKISIGLKENSTFFSNVIGNCYYCIFYSAKAILLFYGIKTKAPNEHKKTLDEFEKLVKNGKIDRQLLKIYEDIVVKADELFSIFKKEKAKRGKFTYKTLPQANLSPAQESLENAEKFHKHAVIMIEGGI